MELDKILVEVGTPVKLDSSSVVMHAAAVDKLALTYVLTPKLLLVRCHQFARERWRRSGRRWSLGTPRVQCRAHRHCCTLSGQGGRLEEH